MINKYNLDNSVLDLPTPSSNFMNPPPGLSLLASLQSHNRCYSLA